MGGKSFVSCESLLLYSLYRPSGPHWVPDEIGREDEEGKEKMKDERGSSLPAGDWAGEDGKAGRR